MDRVKRGRWLVVGIVAVVLLTEAVVTAFYVSQRGTDWLDRQVGRFLVAVALGVWLNRGSGVARYLLSVCLLLGGLLGYRYIVWDNPQSVGLGVGMSTVFLVLAGVLMWSRSVHAFLTHQRDRLSGPAAGAGP